MITLKLTDSESECVLRAVQLQWDYWANLPPGTVQDALRIEQALVWGALHDKIGDMIEGDGK